MNKSLNQVLGSGVGIIINKELGKHISKVYRFKDRIIYIDLLFKEKNKIRILNLYINVSLNNKEERIETINKASKII